MRLAGREIEAADAERVDQRDALRAVGDVDRLRQVVQEDADDLAEAQRDDRQIVAAQLERRCAQQDAEQAGDGGADRQDDPERQMQVEVRDGQQRVDVGADRVEGDIAQVEQAGEADHDVQAERQEDVEDREVGDAHPGGAHRCRARTAAAAARRRRSPTRPRRAGDCAWCRREPSWSMPHARRRPARRAGRRAGRPAPGSARRRRTRPGSWSRTAPGCGSWTQRSRQLRRTSPASWHRLVKSPM